MTRIALQLAVGALLALSMAAWSAGFGWGG